MSRLRLVHVLVLGLCVPGLTACSSQDAPAGTDADGTTSGANTSVSTTPSTSSTSTSGSATASGSSGSTGAATSATSESSGSTTGSIEPECSINADCELADSCCACEAVVVGEAGTPCADQVCMQNVCAEFAVASAECRLGECRPMRVNCGVNKPECIVEPPACGAGTLPEVDAMGCATGRCVPTQLCDDVPDCSSCTTDEMCVLDGSGATPVYRCEPIPAACEGIPSCECAAGACPFGTMCDFSRGTINCKG